MNENASETTNEQIAPADETAAPANPPEIAEPAAMPTAESEASAVQTEQPAESPQPEASVSAEPAKPGPLAARGAGPLAARKPDAAKPEKRANPVGRPGSPPPAFQRGRDGVDEPEAAESSPADKGDKPKGERRPDGKGKEGKKPKNKQIAPPPKPKVAVPSKRAPLADDLEAMLEQELAGAGVEELLSGSAGMPEREALQDGQRIQGNVIKKTPDTVFVSLGGPDEGGVPAEQFEEEPDIGQQVEVVVRGFNSEDGLYILVIPGQAIEASDWDDLEDGTVVEAYISATCNGGVEAKVGSLRAFIPISQLSEFRIEDANEFVDKRLMCVVTECNPRRKNLVLSHRSVLEREREERRKEQLAKIEVGDTMEGTVRNVRDFGAFVDLGGIEGLIHVSKLSWDRIKHPSEVIEEGQKVKVKIEKIDPESGKIGLSYRDLLEHPWENIDSKFPLGTVVKGTVSRVADFGAFVKLATGIEGLVHISELAHKRVVSVANYVSEGDEVEVKVVTVDRDAQRIGLSIKQALAPPEPAPGSENVAAEPEVEEPRPEPCIKRSHAGPLKGGTDGGRGGSQFGLKW